MRIAEYKQTGTETITEQMPILDEEGNETGEVRTITREIPIMSMVYRDMTAEEEAEQAAQQAELEEYERTRPRTVEERLDAYTVESDDAFFDLAEYAATLEEQLDALATRIEALEAING